MQITFLGATGTVTGSKYYLELGERKVLVDCGLFQGLKELRLRNWERLPIDVSALDHVLLTHAHIDHSGCLPLLNKEGFNGTIYSTAGTKDLSEILLADSAHLQEEEALYANRHGYSKHHPALPLYTVNDALDVMEKFVTCAYDQPFHMDEHTTVEFKRAGHIIGSSFVRVRHQDQTILFTGDMGRPHDLVMKAPELIDEVDYLVIESTYGDKVHDKADPCDELADIINRTAHRGGTVVIPAFAVGRTQVLLYMVYLLRKDKRIPDIDIYLDSPMAINATHIFLHYQNEHRLNKNAIEGLASVATYVNSPAESRMIDSYEVPQIIISASGMVTGGRVLHHIKAFAADPKNTILFTGYQAEGTRGRRILDGEKNVKMLGELVPIKAEVAELKNISAHADSVEIVQWLRHFKRAPKKVFITHGEPESALGLKQKIENELHWNCVIPSYLQREKL